MFTANVDKSRRYVISKIPPSLRLGEISDIALLHLYTCIKRSQENCTLVNYPPIVVELETTDESHITVSWLICFSSKMSDG